MNPNNNTGENTTLNPGAGESGIGAGQSFQPTTPPEQVQTAPGQPQVQEMPKPQFGAHLTKTSYKEVMAYQSVLPEDFDGTFRFTNPSDEDFIGIWGGKEYLFPAGKTVPMVMMEYSPLEVQHIRKKFAKDLAEREFYKSQEYRIKQSQEGTPGNRTMSGIHQAATYTLDDLTPYIQACLQTLESAKLMYRPVEKVSLESKLHTDDNGKHISSVVDEKTSLIEKAKLNG